LFGIQLSMLVSLICPYSQEPDHWNHLWSKLITQQFECQQAKSQPKLPDPILITGWIDNELKFDLY
jgi:hypothetical protein